MSNFFAKVWMGAIVSMLGSLLPFWAAHMHSTVLKPVVTVTVPAPAPVKRMAQAVHHVNSAPTVSVRSTVECELSGQTIYQGLPYGNADIDFWISSPRGEELRHIKTQPDGTYHLVVTIPVKWDEPFDWELKAQTTDLKMIHRSGRHIVRDDEPTVLVNNILEFSAD